MTEHVSRWSRRIVAALMSLTLAVGGAATHVAAQEAPTTVVVPIAAVGTDGLSGLALLMPAAGGGTDVQIVVADAPPGTFAVVHRGTCAAIDPTPVALLGDVSTTTQVVVANAIETLADGDHVLALHAGLDLASALGCGAIPKVAGGAPAPTADPAPTRPPSGGGSFTGPITGFSITWPAEWERYEVVESETEDRIGLRNGTTSILMGVRTQPGIDAQTCVRDARQGLFDRLDQGTLRDLAPLANADGSPISGSDGDRAWMAYRYVSVEDGGEFDVADYLECRTSGDHLLSILHRSTPDTYDAAEREALLAGLTLPKGGPQTTPVAGGGSYTAPTLGFSITWDDRWTEIPVTGLEEYEHVGLSDGPSRVVVSGVLDPTWDALSCAQDSDADFQLRASDGRITDLQPLTNLDGSRVRGGDLARAWVGYRYTGADTGGTIAEYHECRAANDVVVRIQHRSLPEMYAREAVARDELLTGLTLPSTSPVQPSQAPVPTRPSTPSAAPLDPACPDVRAWLGSTEQRFDRVAELRGEADEILTRFDIPGYRTALKVFAGEVEFMRSSQAGDPFPPMAADANALAVKSLTLFGEAANGLALYYAPGGATAQRYARAIEALKDAEEAQVDLYEAVARLKDTCP